MASKVKQKAAKPRSNTDKPGSGISDPRFSNFDTDPRYRLSKKQTKVQLDSRFSAKLRDADFSRKSKSSVTHRSKVGERRSAKGLERLYQFEDEEGKDDDGEGDNRSSVGAPGARAKQVAEEAGQGELIGLEDESGEDDEVVLRELRHESTKRDGYDPARDGGFSSSESDSDSEEEDAEVEEIGEESAPTIPTGEVSSRLAIVNLDWDNIRAVDLMAVARSFVPRDGKILDVTIYPSEFGRERLQREELEGPPQEIFAPKNKASKASPTARNNHASDVDVAPESSFDGPPENLEDGDDEEDDHSDSSSDPGEDDRIRARLQEGGEAVDFNSTALRQYQMERLRYYYAIIKCSSSDTAKALYDNMDGREYLKSANFFDLRFVPDDTTFDEEPRDTCTLVPEGYKPAEFITDALQHSKVKLTWDADDRERKEAQNRAFTKRKGPRDIGEDDLAAYVASASSDEEESSEGEQESTRAMFGLEGISSATGPSAEKPLLKTDRAAALRAKLGLQGSEPSKTARVRDEGPVGGLQITFTAGLSAGESRGSVFVNEPQETTKEKYIRKERERKARRKEKMKSGQNGARGGGQVMESSPKPSKVVTEIAPVSIKEQTFDDPFFENPVASNADAAKQAKKAAKVQVRREREAEEEANSRERAELELLMADGDAKESASSGVRHFNMNEIRKAEKEKKCKGKKGKRREDEAEQAGNGQGTFKIPVNDPRFAAIYASHEFAIDPTDARYKETEGMKSLLDEGRRRRGLKREADDDGGHGTASVQKKAKVKRQHDGERDLQSLASNILSKGAPVRKSPAT